MKNKLTALIIFVILLTSSVFSAHAAEPAHENDMGADSVYLNYVGILNTLGIASPDDMSAKVTRGDFAINLCKLMNGQGYSFSEQSFSDVSYDTPELLKAVEFGVAIKAISPGGKFYPNDYITKQQALKMVVVALGYDSEAIVRGGWPYGYMQMADKCSLTDGLSHDEAFDGYDMFMLLGNAANTYVNSVASIIPHENGYITETYEIGKPLLEAYHNIIRCAGVINASDGGYLHSSDSVDSDVVIIGDYSFKKTEGISCPLGYYADIYARETQGGGYKIIYCDISDNNITTIVSDEISKVEEKNVVYFDKDEKVKNLSLSPELAVIYNGRPYTTYNADDFSLAEGFISCISNDGDKVIDVLEIWEPKYLSVKYVDTYSDGYEFILYDENNLNNIYINDDTVVYCNKALGDIGQGEVLEVYESKDAGLIKANVCDDVISGKVTGFSTVGKKIYVDDKCIELTDYFNTYYVHSISVGSDVSLALDTFSKAVASIKENPSTMILAYFDNMCRGTGISTTIELKLFNSSGEVVTAKLSDKVRLNASTLSGNAAYDELGKYIGTLILYNLDSEGKISKISGESAETGIYNPSLESSDSLKRYKFPGADTETLIYYKSFGYFVPHFCISSATEIFVVAKDESDDAKRFAKGDLTFLGNDAKVESKSVIPYNVTQDGHASILLYVTSNAKASPIVKSSSAALVADCSMALDDKDEIAYKLTLYSSNKFTSYYISPEEDFIKSKNLAEGEMPFKTGDYIRYSTDGTKKYIKNVALDFVMESETLNVTERDNSELHYYYGKLYSIGDASFGVLLDSGEIIYLPGSSSVDVGVVEDGDVNTYPIKRMPTYTQVGDNCAKILVKCRYSQVGTRVVYN